MSEFTKPFRFEVEIDGVKADEIELAKPAEFVKLDERAIETLSGEPITMSAEVTLDGGGDFFEWLREVTEPTESPLTRLVWAVGPKGGAMPCLPLGGPYGAILTERGAFQSVEGHLTGHTVRFDAEEGVEVENVEVGFEDPLASYFTTQARDGESDDPGTFLRQTMAGVKEMGDAPEVDPIVELKRLPHAVIRGETSAHMIVDDDLKRDVFFNAAGDVKCSVCGREYREHPDDERESWLTVLCDGTRVKL